MDAITYAMSKKYTDSKITESTGLHREIVNSLPSTGDNSIIYMVLDPNASSPDVYDEWLWVNGTYEHIGSTRVDLTDYYNKTQIDAALSGKANTATTLSGYGISDAYTKTETDTALSGKANTSDIPTALSGLSDDSTHRLVTDAEKGTWNGKANTATSLSGYGITDAYTKTEVDTALDNSKIAVFTQTFSDVTIERDWGALYQSGQLQFDISSLGLQSPPKAVFLGVTQATSVLMLVVLAPYATRIPFYFVRPSQITKAINVTVTALVIY